MARPQFSLRSLFVLTTLVGLGCGLPLIYKRIEARRAAQVMLVYLEALRDGDEDRARATLTGEARNWEERNWAAVKEAANDDTPFFNTETVFTVIRVELFAGASLIGWDRACVTCTYTDLDDDGVPQILAVIYALRRESGDWRISAPVFGGSVSQP
jgi:hypothetical protein